VGKTAFVFPGQGSQKIGMGRDFHDAFPEIRSLYEQAGDILGFDLKSVSFDGPENSLNQTIHTQPALFVLDYGIAKLLSDRGVNPETAAGHSLGEYPALAFAGAFSFSEGLMLVKARSRLMQQASEKNPGKMAAVLGLGPENVMSVCVEAQDTGTVQPANYNSPDQIVISGSREGVQKASELAKAAGAKRVIDLPVSGAFHSPLMSDAVEEFGKAIEPVRFHMVRITVISNDTAAPVSSAQEIKTLLHHQLTHPVRWIETVEQMVKNGTSRFIEVGPGKVLSGLIRKISPEAETLSCGSVSDFNALLEQLGKN
jgi:[acyl-carrier-protein] S-malonyltransferase